MHNKLVVSMLVLFLAIALSINVSAQDVKKEMKKEQTKEMSHSKMNMGPLKSISCDPTCGFMIKDHDEKELISLVKIHVKNMHKKDVSDKDLIAMIKTEETGKK